MTKLEKSVENNKVLPETTLKPTMTKTSPNTTREYDEIIAGTSNSPRINKFEITHYRYKDCESSKLSSIDKYNVHKDAAEAFKEMKKAAKKDGCKLKVVSGYRSSQYQKQIFKRKFNGQYPSSDQMKNRLKYSAPSGYSEHHTGLAVDINETEEIFKNTKEYKWLQEHAHEHGFELSFPENNIQGLGFEPWHWRYVGKQGEYKHIFEEARKTDPRFSKEFRK